MTVPAAIERGPETGASDTPGPSRAHHLRSRRAKQSGSPTGLSSQRLSLSPPVEAATLERLVQARPRRLPRLPPPGRSSRSGRSAPSPSPSFRSITCSQKEVTALLPLSLANSASRIAGGERSHPISMMRSRRESAHVGQNSKVCCTESTLASQWWQRAVASFLIRCKYLPKHPCLVSTGVTL